MAARFDRCPCSVILPPHYREQLKLLKDRHGEALAVEVYSTGECPQRLLEELSALDIRGTVIPLSRARG